jgi:hypothetical protein
MAPSLFITLYGIELFAPYCCLSFCSRKAGISYWRPMRFCHWVTVISP